ncbi:coiled coil domain-containing protein [Crotalus adamanteus]|uniref:Coiled coil domain-containing protein n=1 Tax=Crotalus adamanteus TaxID=8729 RepID=A0AAW1CCH5_CROAD
MSSNVTLKKKANWTSFIKIKPRHDPWQQKLLIKLKQWKKVDEQLQIQSKLLQVSNLEYVMEALQEQAIAMLEPPSMASAFMTSFHSKHYSQIWEKLYRNPEFYQRICLGILNYFRSIERTLTISTSGLASCSGHLIATAEDASWVNAAKGGTGAFGGLGSHSYMHYTPADYKVHCVQFMEFAEVENHDDFYTVEEAYIHTQDQRGALVMYDVALQDLKETEKQLLLVASQYIEVGKVLEDHDINVDRYIPSSLMLEIQDIDNQIRKFSFGTRESILQVELRDLFEAAVPGVVVKVALMKQFAFIQLCDEVAAECAIQKLNGHLLHCHRVVVVEFSRPRPTHTVKTFVGNVSATCTSGELRVLFQEFGSVIKCHIVKGIGCSALRNSLQIVASFHDIIAYIFSFAQLGSAPGCFDYRCPSERLTADWGGTEQIGIELLEIQKKIDSLPNSSDPKKVSQMLTMLKEVKFLQFEAAVRYSMREAFLSSGNVSAYQSITDNIYHALPPMSNVVFGSAFASQLQIPQLLDPHGQRALMFFPWRTFLAKGGLFPDTISNLNPINASMQLCLCSLSTEDQKVAHGELIGIQFTMEDVLWNSEILTDHQEVQKPFRNVKQVSTSTAEAKRKALTAPPDTMTSYALQRSYLIRWKQLEMLKAEWGRLKLKVEDINTVPLYKQFSELYEAEILRAAMRSIARHWGIEDEFEEYGTIPPCSFFHREVSKIDIITHQFQKLLESLEMHMIHDVQKKINKEITLVLSEKAREERHLPTELWKHHSMQEMFSVTRPEIVVSFIQRLMEDHQEINAEIIFQKDHLKKCLTSLACDVMARERSNYETYSMFYENLLRQQHQLLYQKEQEMHVMEGNTETVDVDLSQIARLSHEMILEITALRAKLTDLQRDDHTTKEKIRKEVQEDYEALVQNIFWVCLQIKAKVDEYRLSMNKQMLEIISEVRKEGVEKIINLKKKYGSTKDNSALEEHLAQQGKLQELRDENSELEKLLCKLKALKFWKETMQKAQFLTTLQGVEKEAIQNKNECLQSQMKAEEEAVLFNHQLRAVKKVLTESQTENKKLKQQLEKQEYLLQKAERKINQEFCKRQQLDLIKTANSEKMLENLGEREVTLLNPTEESEKSSKTRHLQEAKMKKEIQQIRSQLTQERNLKLNAFQRIQELQCQLYDSEAAISQNRSPAVTRRSANLSHITKSKHYYFSGSSSCSQNAELPTFILTKDSIQHLLTAKTKLEKIPRPKTVPSGWRKRAIDGLLPDLTQTSHSTLPVQQEQNPSQK